MRARRTELTKDDNDKKKKKRLERGWKRCRSRGRVGPVAEHRSGVGVMDGVESHAIGYERSAGCKAPHLPLGMLVRRELGWCVRPDLRVIGERGMWRVSVLSANSRWHGRWRYNAH